jgi:hypothetical protein
VYLGLAAALALVAGCTDPLDEGLGTTDEQLLSQNGLPVLNGLPSQNGLNTQNGLASGSGLMSTSVGRVVVAYLVMCALPAGRSITKEDQYGNVYTFDGLVGVAPEWETGACGTSCQQWVSSCMLAHINTAGAHVPLWIVADDNTQPQIGWSLDARYPNQEGAFFGNIFSSPPKQYYCNGASMFTNAQPGRLGYAGYLEYIPYLNPWGTSTGCAKKCTASPTPNKSSGFTSCYGYNQVITVWHQ